jgi:NAD(P)-dependent dehydrogenase (short-subunit alcohol dehydrogenase family)
MNQIQIKNIIVAGAAGNLGREAVKKFLHDGKHVVSLVQTQVHRDALLDFLANQHTKETHLILIGDLSTPGIAHENAEKAFHFLGSIDALVSTAGYFHHASVEETTDHDYELLFGSNFKQCWQLARSVLPHMKKMKNGRIVFVSSLATQSSGAEGMSLYLSSKAALNMFTLCLAREVRSYGITVNALMPSVIDTPNNRKAMPKENFSKWIQPDDLISIIESIFSESLRTMNGTLISVPGKV